MTKKNILNQTSIQAKASKVPRMIVQMKYYGDPYKVGNMAFQVLSELGIWPVEELLEHKRIMLFHQILTSNDDRFLKEVIMDQLRSIYPGCWTEQTLEI